MIPWLAVGLGGLIWYAQRTRTEKLLDPGMSGALEREVLDLLKRDLTVQQLESLVEEFERAHYHKARDLFASRLHRLNPAAPRHQRAGALSAELAGETDPAVVRRVASILRSTGQQRLAAAVEARASELESAAPSKEDSLAELLRTASHFAPKATARAEVDPFDGEQDDTPNQEGFYDEANEEPSDEENAGGELSADGDDDELSGEPGHDAPAEDGAVFARRTGEFVRDAASEAGPREVETGEASALDVVENSLIAEDFDLARAVIDTHGTEVHDGPKAKARRLQVRRRRTATELGGGHGT